jgi:glycolate oxidase FAD binding subunit
MSPGLVKPASADDVASSVREAYGDSMPLYPVGGRTSLDFGLPVKEPGRTLSLAGMNRIIDYPARDMTVTVEAGVTMKTIAELLATERQRLPIDVPQADRATIGGVIATNWNGPRRFGEGSLRDFVIGIQAVDGCGTLFKGGGRVVKNVAGYDFCKLLTGSFGSLAVITQATLRLKPIPEHSALVACSLPSGPAAERVLAELVTSKTTPTAVELLAGPLWQNDPALADLARESPAQQYLIVAFEGTGHEVEFMVRQLSAEWSALGVNTPLAVGESASLWQRLIEFSAHGDSPLVLKANVVPSGTTRIVDAALQLDPQCSVQAHAASGIVLIKLSQFPSGGLSRALVGKLQPLAASHGGQVVVLSNPSGLEMTHQSVWGATDAPLHIMAEVKRRFDPRNILNRGRFVV